jgi:hypothetical protein
MLSGKPLDAHQITGLELCDTGRPGAVGGGGTERAARYEGPREPEDHDHGIVATPGATQARPGDQQGGQQAHGPGKADLLVCPEQTREAEPESASEERQDRETD